MKAFVCLLLTTSCAASLAAPPQYCYKLDGKRRCFASEADLSRDVARERVSFELRLEERAKAQALALVAERDAKEAAERAKAAVERADQIHDDAFGVVVEIYEQKAAAATQSAVPSQEPHTPPDP